MVSVNEGAVVGCSVSQEALSEIVGRVVPYNLVLKTSRKFRPAGFWRLNNSRFVGPVGQYE